VRIARRLDVAAIMEGEQANGLPVWERDYLLGLSQLADNHREEARVHLENSWRMSPRQGFIAIALAGLVAPRAPEEALAFLATAEPSRQVLIARAALLARCNRNQEAQLCLDKSQILPGEAARFCRPAARNHYTRLAGVLAVSLLERCGQWQRAATAWASAGTAGGLPATLLKAREYFHVTRELAGLLPHQSWRRSLLLQKISRCRHDLGRAVLNGDALFYWAAGNCHDDPAEAVKGFRRLIRQRAWTEAQQRVGGDRLVIAGDVLLRQGDDAVAGHAYTLAHISGHPEVVERLAVAKVMGGEKPEIAAATWYPPLLAALRFAATDRMAEAAGALAAANALQAPEVLCRIVENIVTGSFLGSVLTEEDLAGLALPATLAPVVRLLAGPGSLAERAAVYLAAHGLEWSRGCPLSPTILAATLAEHLCTLADWPRAMAAADGFLASGDPALHDVGLLLRVLYSLGQAEGGDVLAAEASLSSI
jgi:hypothetical protein